MLNKKLEEVLEMLIKIDSGLTEGVTLTFAVENLAHTLEETAKQELRDAIYALIEAKYLNKHSNNITENGIPFWLELTNRGREYFDTKQV